MQGHRLHLGAAVHAQPGPVGMAGRRASAPVAHPLATSIGTGLMYMMLTVAAPALANDNRLDDLQRLLDKYGASTTAGSVGGSAAVPVPVAGMSGEVAASGAGSGQGDAHGSGGPGHDALKAALARKAAAAAATLQARKDAARAALEALQGKAPVTGVQALLGGVGNGVAGVLAAVTDPAATLGAAVGEVADGAQQLHGTLHNVLSPGKEEPGNPLRDAVTSTVASVVDTTGGVLVELGVGGAVGAIIEGAVPLLDTTGVAVGSVVVGATGSTEVADGVANGVQQLAAGLGQAGQSLAKGELVEGVQTLLTGAGTGAGTVVGGVADAVAGVTGSVSGVAGLGQGIGTLLAGVTGGGAATLGQVTGAPMQPSAVPAPAGPSGLIVGNGGVVGTLGQVLGPTLSSVLAGGSAYVQNGSLTVSSANFAQAYSVTSVLGIPAVNLRPVGQLLDGLGGLATGGNSHLTLIGGVTSDSYIYNINNGDPNGLLGLLLPDRAPAWARKCLDVLGLVQIDCWGVPAAQDYQVLIGDGAYANGSKEVVIGSNARHQLAAQDANAVFPGRGANDAGQPSGVPTADYDARQGHSVVVGDSAVGTANAQTLLGAGATSDKANSVALGYRSNASRGGMDGYTAYGLSAPQTSIGEVAVGSAGRERQITHVAAATQATDAVNLRQLQGAIALIGTVEQGALRYDVTSGGQVDYTRATLGAGAAPTGTVLDNVASGALVAGGRQAVNAGQLLTAGQSLAGVVGGGAAFLADGTFRAPTFRLNRISASGSPTLQDYLTFDTAFASISDSLGNLSALVGSGSGGSRDPLAVRYSADAAGDLLNEVAFSGDGSGAAVAVRNVAAGVLTAGSLDALNAGQLVTAGQSLAGLIGGGAAFLADGTFSAPTFRINRISVSGTPTLQDYLSFDTAFASISDSLGNLSALVGSGGSGHDPLAVRYSVNATGDLLNEVALTGNGSGAAVAVRNVAAGAVSLNSADAINGSQLFAVAQGLAGYLGGGARVSASGALLAPSYQIYSVRADGALSMGTFADVGAGFSSISSSLASLRSLVSTGGAGVGTGLNVQYTAGADGAAGNAVVLSGADDGQGVAVRNVAAGQLVAGSRDAVNGGQLAAAQAALSAAVGGNMGFDPATGQWHAPSFNVSRVDGGGGVSVEQAGSVGEAVAMIDGSLVNINKRLENIQNGGAGSAYFAMQSVKGAATASGQDSLAAGPNATASAAQSVAVGDSAIAYATGSVALGAGSVASRADTVSVGAAGAERQVVNVADGTQDTDAVNVRQLQAVKDSSVGYGVNEDGSIDYSSLILGRPQTAAVVHNVAQGVSASDAVNVSQLNSRVAEAIDWSRAYTDQRIDTLNREMRSIDNRASAGIASAMAMAGLPQPTDPGKRMAAMAASTFHGESSMAVGVSGVTDGGRWIYKFSGSANSRGDGGVTVGAGFQW